LEFQSADDAALLNYSDPLVWELRSHVIGRLYAFGDSLPSDMEGGYIEAGVLRLRIAGAEFPICSAEEVSMAGGHNLMNVLAAGVLSSLAGVPVEAIRQVAREFRGVPHRLEYVRTVDGADWYNDSIATTPDRAIAAIEAFDAPVVLLAGGRDKDLDWGRFAEVVHQRVRAIVLFGEAAEKIESALVAESADTEGLTLKRVASMRPAVKTAAAIARQGDVVLLSPGGTSFDEFENYELRGEEFRRLVRAI
jgi:UDP-N-acetylmuramoylalanine--D-glutamate ligase